MRKFTKLSIALGVTLLSSLASAADTLTVWEDIQKSDGIKDAIAAFEKEYNVKVDLKEMPFVEQLDKVRLDGPAGIGPDVMLIPHDRLGSAVVQGLITPLKFMEQDKDKYTEASVSAFSTNGSIYGCPKVVETIVMFYNKDILAKPFDTLEEYYNFSKEAVKTPGNYGLLAKWDSIYYAYGALEPYGAYVFKRDAEGNFNVDDIGLNNAGAIEGVNNIKRFYSESLFPVGIVGDQGGNAIDSLFTEKKAAAVITGPWNLDPYKKAGVNYGVVPLPKLQNGKDMASFMGVKGYVVSNWSKDHDLAEKFIQFINQPQYVKTRYEITNEIPPVKAVMEDPIIKDNEIASAIAVQASRATPMPSIPEMGEVWTPIDAALQLVVNDKQKTEDALNNAVSQIHDQIEAFRDNN